MEVRCPLCSCQFEIQKEKTSQKLIQGVIEAYKIAKNIKTKEQDRNLFKRYSRDAKQLLSYLDDNLDLAIDCIADESIKLALITPEWHLGSVVKRAAEWRVRNGR